MGVVAICESENDVFHFGEAIEREILKYHIFGIYKEF